MSKTREEVLQHLYEVCFGYGNATGPKLRALELMGRLLELQQAEDNFGVPLPFRAGPADPDAIRVVERWRSEECAARRQKDASFFKDVARALDYLKREEQMQPLDSNVKQGDVKRLTALRALRLITARKDLPSRAELIGAVEREIASHKTYKSPLAPSDSNTDDREATVQVELELLRKRRLKKELNWPRILKALWLFDFLPTR